MRILGISEGSHDACWALIENGRILEAHHAERHSRIKNDKWLNPDLLPEADVIVGHQFLDKVNERRKWAGQKPMKRNIIPDVEYNHHETHAWAGWATAPFDDCDILTMDAVGEWDTSTVHEVRNGNWKKTFGMKFPKSYGMPYSHVTSLLGYKPMQDEYITMAMAAYGARYDIPKVEVPGGRPPPDNKFVLQKFHRHNLSPLFQGSCDSGTHYIFQPRYQKDHVKDHKGSKQEKRNLARNIQEHYEFYFLMLIEKYCHHKNLIIMGGCALNCVANTKVEGKNIWIMPNPGDGGSALGAAARHYGKQLKWKGPYLGTEVPRMDPQKIVDELLNTSIAAVCSGRAEFGPRALGNRSLLADPKGGRRFPHPHITKDTIDRLKNRQSWRPFSPAILAEHYDEYFMGTQNKYMQFVSQHKQNGFTLVTHIDNSARVQIVTKDCSSILREVLELWNKKTGCPMLLNTSLNVAGEPIVNTMDDYRNFIKWSSLNDIS